MISLLLAFPALALACSPIPSAERTIAVLENALRGGDHAQYASVLTGEARAELGSRERMEEWRQDFEGKKIVTGMSAELKSKQGSASTSTVRIQLITEFPKKPHAHELDAVLECAKTADAECAYLCKIASFSIPSPPDSW